MNRETKPAKAVRSASHWGAFTAEVSGGRVVGVQPFAGDPAPSPLLGSIPDSVHGSLRVVEPAVRQGWLEAGPGGRGEARGAEPFVAVSWEEALDLVAGELRRVKETHGNAAIFGGSYGWSSAGGFHRANFQLYRFLNLFGGFTEKVDSYSFAAGTTIMPHVIGDKEAVVGRTTAWPAIVDNTRLMVMFGGVPLKNTQVEYGGVGRHMTETWLRRARAKGIEFVSIGLVEDDAPGFLEAEWIAPRPNTDVALMLGIAYTLAVEGLHDRAFLDRYTVGYDRFEAYLLGRADGRPKDAAWAAAIAEVDAETIRGLARRMAGTRTLVTMTWALQRADHGEQPYWMAVTLAAMLGQIGLAGGGFGFGYGCESGIGTPRHWIPVPILPFGENPTGSFIPVARVSDMLLHPGAAFDYNGRRSAYPDVRLVYWAGGNPFHHHQDLNKLLRAFRRPETIVVHEPFWTATARHADVVLPATTPLERNDLAASSRDRFILAIERAIAPQGQARNDHDILAALAQRLGFRDAFTEGRDEMGWLRHLYDVTRQQAARHRVEMPDFDAFWRHGHVEIPEPERPFVLLEDFRRDPGRHPLKTPSGRIELYSETIAGFGYDDCPPHAAWLEPAEWLGSEKSKRYPLHLLSNQPSTRLHGQMDDGRVSVASKVKGREPVWIHPADAAPRGIRDGDVVRVFNDRGEVLAGACVTDRVRRSVVQLAIGASYDPERPGHAGARDKHGNANVLTLDKGSSRLAQAPIAHTALVEVAPFAGEPPAVTAFQPPPFVRRARRR